MRLRRLTRKLAVLLLEALIVVTGAAVAYNLATADRVKPVTALYPGPFVHADGRLIAYRHWGQRGAPVILLGGFIVPSDVWNALGRMLGRDHRVFALDLPPFGYSQRKGPYTLRAWVDLVSAFERRFRLRRPVVVGHSLSAAVAVGEALWKRSETRGIVLLDGDAIAASGPPSWVTRFLVGPWFTSLYRIVTGADWVFRRGLSGAYPNHPRFTQAFLDEWERPFRAAGTLGAFRSMLRYGIQGFRLPQLRGVNVPALVLWGGRDTVDSVGAGRNSAQALHAPFHVIPRAGHLSMLAAPAAIAREIDAFAQR
jgi:pimeloyl-ACP methyl ester carboxylesterase